jgi:hypothetical protein
MMKKLEQLLAKRADLYINQENGLIELRSKGAIIEAFECINLIDLEYVNVFEFWGGYDNLERLEVRSAISGFSEDCVKVDGHFKCKNGSLIIPTSHHFCMLIREKVISEFCIITMRGLDTKASRRWNIKAMEVVKDKNNFKYTPPKYTHIYSSSAIREKGRYMWDFSNPIEIMSSETLNYLMDIKNYISNIWKYNVYGESDN